MISDLIIIQINSNLIILESYSIGPSYVATLLLIPIQHWLNWHTALISLVLIIIIQKKSDSISLGVPIYTSQLSIYIPSFCHLGLHPYFGSGNVSCIS